MKVRFLIPLRSNRNDDINLIVSSRYKDEAISRFLTNHPK